MKKIYNPGFDPSEQSLQGFLAANSSRYLPYSGLNAVISRHPRGRGKVKLVIGGGSGHEPMFAAFVGRGLADAAVCGHIFAAPNPDLIYRSVLALEPEDGVLFLYGNYAGDNMNFDVAEELLGEDGIPCAHLRVMDDCASAPKARREERRGIAGDVFAVKILGAACDDGLGIEELLHVGEKLTSSMGSIGLATYPGTVPGADKASFELGENEIEYGMGLHGEPGITRTQMQPAERLTDRLYRELKAELSLQPGDEICVLVNSLGSTTMLEMNIVYLRLDELLRRDGIQVHDADINGYCTCQDMGGFSISLLRLDEELRRYFDAPCSCPVYTREDRR